MSKCKYCEIAELNNMPTENLINKTVHINIFSVKEDIEVGAMIYRSDKNQHYLSLFVDHCEFDKAIKYCPMCGRKLEVTTNE